MEATALTPERYADWDQFCEESPDSWLWHRSHWLRFSSSLIEKDLVRDLSFFVMDGSRRLAVVPCFAETNRGQEVALKYGRVPLPWPVIAPNLVTSERQSVEAFIFETLQARAKELGISQIEMTSHVTPQSFFQSSFAPASLPNRYGYRSETIDTWVVDLTQTPEALWAQVRKGHKSSIKTGQKLFTLQTWYGDISRADFSEYQALHALAAGRVTRSQITFDVMRELIERKEAFLIGAKQDNRWMGFVLVMAYKKAAYYGSACKHPDVPPSASVGHVLLWQGILELRKTGHELFEMGPQIYTAPEGNSDQEKLVNISLFKRGFGGFPMPRYTSKLALPAAKNS